MIYFLRQMTKLFDVLRPIAWSAFSLFICFCALQPIVLWLDPAYSLLANRGPGKIIFTLLVVAHLFVVAARQSKQEWQYFLQTNVFFITKKSWLKPFFGMFATFAGLHSLMLLALANTSFVTLDAAALLNIASKMGSLTFGFVATFFLAWTEEAIFRGTIVPLLRSRGLGASAAILTSAAIFMLAHDVTAPWSLVTTALPLGVGLFLLGVLLAQLFVLSNTLYWGMGAHAGLVFIKVLLRRIPAISYADNLPWWLHSDLRQSPLVHACFLLLIVSLFWYQKSKNFRTKIV
jgi:hypothetical protein